jgi:hypothetical protein
MSDQLGRWYVLIEENEGSREWREWVHTATKDAGTDRDAAEAYALKIAAEYAPHHPFSPSGRQIFQVGTDQWIVVVQGAASVHRFHVSLGRLVANL